MVDGNGHIVVLITASDQEEAEAIGQTLLRERLAACYNVVPSVSSCFWWQGSIENSHESLLIVKSTREHLDSLVIAVKKAHSYDVPETIALPIIGGNPEYLEWLSESVNDVDPHSSNE